MWPFFFQQLLKPYTQQPCIRAQAWAICKYHSIVLAYTFPPERICTFPFLLQVINWLKIQHMVIQSSRSRLSLQATDTAQSPHLNQSDVLSTNYLLWIVYQTQGLKTFLSFATKQRVHTSLCKLYMYAPVCVCVGRWHLWLTLRVRPVSTDISNIQSTLTVAATGRHSGDESGGLEGGGNHQGPAGQCWKEHTELVCIQHTLVVQCFSVVNEGNITKAILFIL